MATPSAHLLNAASFANLSSSTSSKTSQRRLPSKLARHVLVVSLFLVVLGAALPSSAATHKVTSLVDNSSSLTTAGTLRYWLANAASGDTIVFSVTGTITLDCTDPGDGPLVISQNVTISGPGAANLAISGGLPSANACQVFVVNPAVTATISRVTIENGICSSATCLRSGGGIQNRGTLTVSNSTLSGNSGGVYNGNGGGGIFNDGGTLMVSNSTLSGNSGGVYNGNGGGGIFNDGGTLMVSNSTLSANSADEGGGIYNDGTLTVSNSTLSANTAVIQGGGIVNTGTLTVSDSTLSGNSSTILGGGGIVNDGTLTLKSTLLANESSGGNCILYSGTPTSDGYNLSDDSSCTLLTAAGDQNDVTNAATYLGPLANNGSPTTQTIALLPGSTAINAIPVTPVNECTDAFGNPVTTDQRGVTRPQGTGCDIGAFELILSPQVSASPSSVDFDDVELCRTKTALLALHDNDATLVQIGPVSIIDVTGNPSDFSLRPPYSTTGILGPKKGHSYQIQVKFSPSAELAESATLNIVTNAPGSPVQVPITGTGIKGPKGCDLNP
jgi:hypothetical protein